MLKHNRPEPQDSPATEAVKFDPFADDNQGSPATEAVPYNPFADDDDEDDLVPDSPGTAAVKFDCWWH